MKARGRMYSHSSLCSIYDSCDEQSGCLIQQNCSRFCAAGTNKRLDLGAYRQAFGNPGWSNVCSLVGHFSKLFELAGLSRLEIPIFVRKSWRSLKKGFHLESVSTLDSVPSARHALLYKVAAACDRQDLKLCKIVPRAAGP